MSHIYFLSTLIILFSAGNTYSQKKWDGGGGNSAWNNALNWVGNIAPTATDDVVLDNSIITVNYSVLFSVSAVTVKSITISPAVNRSIELSLPPANTLAPALTVTGPGYGLVINSGGVFRNASGSSSGVAIHISDSIKINNSGRYIHNSAGGHATNVQVLSAAPGTETGIFELDIPAASSTISLSGRIFGRLVLRAAAAGGTCNYTAAGTSRVLIRNNLELLAGVTFNLNFSDTIFVNGNFIQEAGTFNLGNAPRSVVINIRQNFTQATGAVITETGTGTQAIAFSGPGIQLLSARGVWQNQVAFLKTGTGDVLLKTALSLPYKLILKSGRVVSTDEWLLTLQPLCTVESDSLAERGYVSGPLKKEGLANNSFMFPVGGGITQRWLRLENASGTFTVEHVKSNPQIQSNIVGSGLHHISSVEYWNVVTSGVASAAVKLSFNDPQSGGVTNLSALRVARLNGTTWQNAGAAAYSGSPGSNGWVSSVPAGGFSANTKSFALASAISQENPLPLINISFKAKAQSNKIHLWWAIEQPDVEPKMFEVQQSQDGKQFETCLSSHASVGQREYHETITVTFPARFYRLRIKNEDDSEWHYSAMSIIDVHQANFLSFPSGNTINHTLPVLVNSEIKQNCIIEICDVTGRKLYNVRLSLYKGSNLLNLNVAHLVRGMHYLHLQTQEGKKEVRLFVKR